MMRRQTHGSQIVFLSLFDLPFERGIKCKNGELLDAPVVVEGYRDASLSVLSVPA